MTANKDLKRLVRARMEKTGESYTSARAQITRKPKPKSLAAEAKSAALKNDYAKLAGMSDAVIKEKTGCTWEKWVKSLDYYGAERMSHREIATLVSEKYKVPSWWTQTVTVGYERIKGLRARGQRRDGTFEASKSRTFNVPVETLFDAWAESDKRKKWLTDKNVKFRSATKPKYLRLDWQGNSVIAVGFLPKGESKSSVAVQHTKLPDRETAERLKKHWSEQLDNLSAMLKAL
jgi:uncharacterized protein YndB with AHSA1/START domain